MDVFVFEHRVYGRCRDVESANFRRRAPRALIRRDRRKEPPTARARVAAGHLMHVRSSAAAAASADRGAPRLSGDDDIDGRREMAS